MSVSPFFPSGRTRFHPKPKGLLPAPELYEFFSLECHDHSQVYLVVTVLPSVRLTKRRYHSFCSGSLANASAACWLSNRIIERNSRALSTFLSRSPER